jgi:hypothetical protein
MSKKPKVRQRGKSGRAQNYAMSHTSFPVPTMAEFYDAKTRKGGWTAETLARWASPTLGPKAGAGGWRNWSRPGTRNGVAGISTNRHRSQSAQFTASMRSFAA